MSLSRSRTLLANYFKSLGSFRNSTRDIRTLHCTYSELESFTPSADDARKVDKMPPRAPGERRQCFSLPHGTFQTVLGYRQANATHKLTLRLYNATSWAVLAAESTTHGKSLFLDPRPVLSDDQWRAAGRGLGGKQVEIMAWRLFLPPLLTSAVERPLRGRKWK